MTETYLNETCKPGHGAATCSYLVSSVDGFICAKLRDGMKRLIDDRRSAESIRAMGDNCDGDADFLIVPPITAIRRPTDGVPA